MISYVAIGIFCSLLVNGFNINRSGGGDFFTNSRLLKYISAGL